MKTTDRRIKLLSVVLVLISLLFCTGILDAMASNLTDSEQDKINEYKEKMSDLDSEIQENKAKMDALKGNIEEQKAYVVTLQSQIDAYQTQIDVLNGRIDSLEAQKDELKAQILELQSQIEEIEVKINHNELEQIALDQEIEDTYNELEERLCNLYMYGRTSELELLLDSTDFKSFLISMELSSNIAKRDNEIVDELNRKIKKIDDLNSQHKALIEERESEQAKRQADIDLLDANEKEIVASRSIVESNQGEVQSLMSEAMQYIAELNAQSESYQYLVNKYEADKKKLDAEIDYIIEMAKRREYTATFTPSDGFVRPLQFSDVYISSPYGTRYLSGTYSTFHGGVDLCRWSGTYNQPAVATASGIVIYSGFNGYGNCVMIDHGNGIISLYGHLNSRAVYEDQAVSQGQVIGYTGSTYGPGGYSTGNHLHFEIRVNGSKVNPQNYVPLP